MPSFDPHGKYVLWSHLELFFDTREERDKWTRTYFINTTADLFLQWLKDSIDCNPFRHRPLARVPNGELFLGSVQIQIDSISEAWVLWNYRERVEQTRGPADFILRPVGAFLHFKTVTLAVAGRIKVVAECESPRGLEYYRSLLAELGSCWPEAGVEETLNHYKAKLFRRKRPNADRDAEIFRLFNDEGKKKRELADQFNLSEDRIKQILREQREKDRYPD